VSELSIGDILAVQALISNPLDWNHFYEKISVIKEGDRTHFTVVTDEGDRLVGLGNVELIEKWSNNGKYGFKIKVRIKKQKSLTDRRTRTQSSEKGNGPSAEKRGSKNMGAKNLSQALLIPKQQD
jgi:hypothetical protein